MLLALARASPGRRCVRGCLARPKYRGPRPVASVQ